MQPDLVDSETYYACVYLTGAFKIEARDSNNLNETVVVSPLRCWCVASDGVSARLFGSVIYVHDPPATPGLSVLVCIVCICLVVLRAMPLLCCCAGCEWSL